MNCGPFFDDLEVARGWRVDPDGTDTATDGAWQRGDPLKGDLQLGSAASGQSVLITGRRAGHDVDGGRTTVRSPLITLPDDGRATLRLRYWVGLTAAASGKRRAARSPRRRRRRAPGHDARGLRRRAPSASRRWSSLAEPLPADLGGRRVAIELVAVDAGDGAIVEAAVDQVRITAD